MNLLGALLVGLTEEGCDQAMIAGLDRCTQQFVHPVVRRLRYHSNPDSADPSIAVIATPLLEALSNYFVTNLKLRGNWILGFIVDYPRVSDIGFVTFETCSLTVAPNLLSSVKVSILNPLKNNKTANVEC